MSNIEITLEGGGIRDVFHNDWDRCEERGLLHIEDLEGWFGGVGSSVTPDLQRFRRHGKFPGRAIRSSRKMDLTLTWLNTLSDESENAYAAAARLASSIAWDEGPYTMTVKDDSFELSTQVQLDGEPVFQPIRAGSEDAFRMRVPLVATDPFLYSPPETTIISGYTRTPVVLPNGFGHEQFNKDGEQVLAWSVPVQNPAALTNVGTANAYPVVTIVGNSPAGAEIVLNKGTVQYAAPIFEQSPLVIDYRKGSATINGRDVSFNLRKREWTHVAPHTSAAPRLTFLSDGASGYAQATLRSTWI